MKFELLPFLKKNKTMNVVQKNKLLADFLGYEIEETLKGEKVYAIKLPDATGFKTDFYTPKELKFHYDWNWLMLVIEAIFDKGDFEDWNMRLNDCILSLNIEVVYNACIEFVQWFNGCGSKVGVTN